MPKLFALCVVSLMIAAVSVMPTQPVNEFWYLAGCFIAAAVCYVVTLFEDEKNENKPSWKQRLSCSIAASYLAFSFYPSVKDFEIEVIFTTLKFKPFPSIHVFIGLCSYFGLNIFREFKTIGNFGFKKWLGKIGDTLKAASKEKK